MSCLVSSADVGMEFGWLHVNVQRRISNEAWCLSSPLLTHSRVSVVCKLEWHSPSCWRATLGSSSKNSYSRFHVWVTEVVKWMDGGSLTVHLAFTHLHELSGFFLDQNRGKESLAVQNLDHNQTLKRLAGVLHSTTWGYYHNFVMSWLELWKVLTFPQVPGFADRKRG